MPRTDSETLYSRGNDYYHKEKYEEAEKCYTHAIFIHKEDNPQRQDNEFLVKLYNNRGNAYCQLSKNEKALADYNEALELKQDVDTYSNRGRYYKNAGDFDAAISDCNNAIQLEKEDVKQAKLYNNRGLVFVAKGKLNKAFADFAKAILLNPKCDYANENFEKTIEQLTNPQILSSIKKLSDKDQLQFLEQYNNPSLFTVLGRKILKNRIYENVDVTLFNRFKGSPNGENNNLTSTDSKKYQTF